MLEVLISADIVFVVSIQWLYVSRVCNAWTLRLALERNLAIQSAISGKLDRSDPAVLYDGGMGSQEVQGDPPPLANPPTKSWVTVAKEKKFLKKYEVDISISEGIQSVIVPSEIVEQANPLWEDFVIARFLETAPHVAKVHVILNKIWAFGDKDQKLDVYEMDETTMRVRIPNAVVREKVIRRGMWNIAGIPMVASKWSPIEDEGNKLTPLWVYLKNVPMSMYSWEGLSFITSAVGIPDHLHPETIACTNFEIAKICVKTDLSKPLPKKIDYKINGEDITVEYIYPWLPNHCDKCGKWGHLEAKCGRKENREEKDQKKEMVDKKDEMVQKKSEAKMVTEEGCEEATLKIDSGKKLDIEEGQITDQWLTPGKTGRSSEKKNQTLKYGEVRIATPSRFSALSTLDDEEEKGNKVVELEDEEMGKLSEKDVVEEGIEEIREVAEEEKSQQEETLTQRQVLPRESKARHKVLSDGAQNAKATGPSNVSRKGTRKQNH